MADDTPRKERHVLVGVTGSVATIKLRAIVEGLLKQDNVKVQVVATEHARHFFDASELPSDVQIHTDADEWTMWQKRGDPVLHIELRRWADVLVIAPLDANTLAKLACGLSDNLLTCVVRAWDPARPILVCPAMNTHMWTNPLTAAHLSAVTSQQPHIRVLEPISKALMCGDVGLGAMAEPADIVDRVAALLGH